MTTSSKALIATTEALKDHLAGRPTSVPESGRLVWRWFLALNLTRTSNGFGPASLSYAEIEAYARLYRWPMEPRHVDMILAMDRAYLDHFAHKQRNAAQGRADLDNAPPMNLNAFDAVFGASP